MRRAFRLLGFQFASEPYQWPSRGVRCKHGLQLSARQRDILTGRGAAWELSEEVNKEHRQPGRNGRVRQRTNLKFLQLLQGAAQAFPLVEEIIGDIGQID